MQDADLKAKFIEGMREWPIVRHACEFSGIPRTTAYRWRDDDAEFAGAWADARQDGLDRLKKKAWAMAHEGDTGLLKWIISTQDPEYAERTKHEIAGAGGAPLEVILSWHRKPRADVTDGDTEADPDTPTGAA